MPITYTPQSASSSKLNGSTKKSTTPTQRPGSAPKQISSTGHAMQPSQSHGHVGSLNTRTTAISQGSSFSASRHQDRPGSAKQSSIKKQAPPTPSQMLGEHLPMTSQMLSNNHSMVIRNSNSLGSMQQKPKLTLNQSITNANKSVLTSFRNGPVKVLNSTASSGQIGVKSAHPSQPVNRVGSMHQHQNFY